MQGSRLTVAVLIAALSGGACAGPGPSPAAPAPAAPAMGPLALSVVYPPPPDDSEARAGLVMHVRADATYVIQARDSTFLLGGTGRGDTRLLINGVPVSVHAPTGGWLAWLPLPDDSLATFDLLAVAGADTARLVFAAPIAPRFRQPAGGVWVDTTSFDPVGAVWVRPGEGLALNLVAAPGAVVRGTLPDGSMVGFVEAERHADTPWGMLAFDLASGAAASETVPGAYSAWVTGPVGPDPGPVMAPTDSVPSADRGWMWLEAARAGDTTRVRWPLRVGVLPPGRPTVVVVDDDTAHTGGTDATLPGRPSPSGTYHWFFPNGTRAAVSGRRNGQVRLQLSGSHAAWVDAADLRPVPEGTPPPAAIVRSLRARSSDRSVTVRIPVSARVPFRVSEDTREISVLLYGATADADWIQYGGTDPFVRQIAFDQVEQDVVEVLVELNDGVWGYRTQWVGGALELEIRRPPAIDAVHPLRGRVIALDAGHPPGGARGPTGSREPDVVLAVAREARRLLEAEGATVVMTRSGGEPLGLWERVRDAEAVEAEILVSVHANALPDGVNPFTNNGTSVYYYHPRSAPLARALDRALVARLGVRDLGFGRGDLALVRGTWMPSALTEGLFMIVPEQEAMLLSAAGQRRYAQGIVEGVETFLRERAQGR